METGRTDALTPARKPLVFEHADDSAHKDAVRLGKAEGGGAVPASHGRAAFYVDANDLKKEGLEVDDDGVIARKGTWLTVSGHIITAVIGSGVLSLPWAFAQIGWGAAPIILILFASVTWYCSMMLADCYRSPDPITGKRNYTYVNAVGNILGGRYKFWCGLAQYTNFVGTSIGYTITAGLSMAAVHSLVCIHNHPAEADAIEAGDSDVCLKSDNQYFIIFGAIQILFSQLPDMDRLWILSALGAIMSFMYSFILLGLSIAKAAGNDQSTGTVDGLQVGIDVTQPEKIWLVFNALGAIAFAFSFSFILVEIQDTIMPRPDKGGEASVMKKAAKFSISVTSFFYLTISVIGFAAFGNNAPGNLVSSGGFENPYWLVVIANLGVAIHLVAAYQVWTQPFYGFVESATLRRVPQNWFMHKELPFKVPGLGIVRLNGFRLVWRTAYVVVITIIACLIPFFNTVVGFLGALGFWPLTIFFPILMHIKQKNIPRFTAHWFWLQFVNMVCLCVSLAGAIGSIEQLTQDVQGYQPFDSHS